ncbi:MAG: hypothetical protein IIC13_06770 [SAR324 cluster bacterium]|nr:hypothetical protein [SAR324 cluster bacterium]MCH8886274.1 hypothetical protein [SAR324 cluster bacterium]
MIIGTPIHTKFKAGKTPCSHGWVSPEDYLGNTTRQFGSVAAKAGKGASKRCTFFFDSPHAGGNT